MNKELDVAKSIIINHLNTNLSMESLDNLYEITHGNKKVLLAHIKACSRRNCRCTCNVETVSIHVWV